MPRSVAYDPVCSRTGTTQVVVPQQARSGHVALDPLARHISGDQTVFLPLVR